MCMDWNISDVYSMRSWVEYIQHLYHMVDILLDLVSCYTTLVLGRQWIPEDILGSIQIYDLLCAWNFLVVVCPLFLSLAWHFVCQYAGTKINVTTIWGLGLEVIIVIRIVNHTEDTASSGIITRLFLQIEPKFTSDKEYFLFEMRILTSLVLWGACRKGEIAGNKRNIRSFTTIWLDVTNTGPLVWMVVESKHFCNVSLGHHSKLKT